MVDDEGDVFTALEIPVSHGRKRGGEGVIRLDVIEARIVIGDTGKRNITNGGH